MERCIEYVALDWPSVIEPIREELAAVAIDSKPTQSLRPLVHPLYSSCAEIYPPDLGHTNCAISNLPSQPYPHFSTPPRREPRASTTASPRARKRVCGRRRTRRADPAAAGRRRRRAGCVARARCGRRPARRRRRPARRRASFHRITVRCAAAHPSCPCTAAAGRGRWLQESARGGAWAGARMRGAARGARAQIELLEHCP
jgi:hypothetical protein